MRWLALPILALLFAIPARADERIAYEDFARAESLIFGPDNATKDALHGDALAPFPFDHSLALKPGERISTDALATGPTDRGTLEDVVWVDLRDAQETVLGPRGDFTVVRFETGGPELRLVRSTARPEAALQWFDGINWNVTGIALALDRRYRLRVVMDLETGTMDVFVREESEGLPADLSGAALAKSGRENPAVLGASFRPFAPGVVRRSFALGHPTGMRASLSAWQLWRNVRSELVRRDPSASANGPFSLRYAADATLEGDAVRRPGDAGGVSWTLVATSGLRDDFELPDISRWMPAARVQRQTGAACSGHWALGLSEGSRPVDTEVHLPPADFDLKLKFLVPKDLLANRQIYLVRFKSIETGAEPVGPALYLDYGAAPGGKSLIIVQLKPDQYFSQEVDVKCGVWYGLTVSTRRALSGYTATFVDAAGTEVPINEGKALPFFQGTPTGERLLWRFFSLMAMRPGMTEWPKVELKTTERRVPVTFSAEQRKALKGLTLRGIRRDKKVAIHWDDKRVFYNLMGQAEIIDKNWPEFRIGPEQAEKLKDYEVLFVEGSVFLPWGDVDLAYGTNGTMRLMTGSYVEYVPAEPTGAGEFRVWSQAAERPRTLGRGVAALSMLYVPPASGDLRAELRWMVRGQAQAFPGELIRGQDVTLTHPGLSFDPAGAAWQGDRLLVATRQSGLETYDRNFVRLSWEPARFEKQISPYYGVSSFTWDPYAACFYATSGSPRLVVKYDRTLTFREQTNYTHDAAAMAAGPEGFYFVTKGGDVVLTDKFFGISKSLPMDKMFGGKPLFSAAACVDRFLYLATRADSPILPLQVICVDTSGWHPIFAVDLKDRFGEVHAMASDGETLTLLSRADARAATLVLPPRHELDLHQTFVCLDDLQLTPRRSTEDVPLLPGPAGGAEGWVPPEAVTRNPKGEGWVVRTEGIAPSLERRDIVAISPAPTKDSVLRVRLADPSGQAMFRIDLQVRDSLAQPRVLILYSDSSAEASAKAGNPDVWNRTYTVPEFFRRPEFAVWRNRFPYWSYHLAGGAEGHPIRAFRPMLIGGGVREHALSLEKDFGLKGGDVVDGVAVGCWRECPPVLSMTVSPSEWVEKTSSAGAVTSRVARVEEDAGRLDFVSWEETPFDVSRGSMRLFARTADEKYFMDRQAWTPVENGKRLGLPLGRFLQWRVEMATKDPWRPPGVSGLLFGVAPAAAGPRVGSTRTPWLVLGAVLLAALLAALVISRRSLWERRKTPPPQGEAGSLSSRRDSGSRREG